MITLKEKILWKREQEKNLYAFEGFQKVIIFIVKLIFLFVTSWFIIDFITDFIKVELTYMDLVVGLLLSLILLVVLKIIENAKNYNRKVVREFPLDEVEIEHYPEYDIITERKLIQKKFNYIHDKRFNPPDKWLQSNEYFGNFNPDHYPGSLLKYKRDKIILDLTKINLIVNNYRLHRILFLEMDATDAANLTKAEFNSREDIDLSEFASIDFDPLSDSKQQRFVSIILKRYFNWNIITIKQVPARIY